MEEKSNQTVEAAIAEKASTNVVTPAKEVKQLARVEAAIVGPPKKPATESTEDLAAKMTREFAILNSEIAEFKVANNENTGKKIEGTGLIRVPYFYWIGGIVAVLVVVYFVGKLALRAAAMANPGAAIGLNVVNAASSVVAKGFSQLVKGGETFKDWVKKEVQDAGLQEKILKQFQSTHMQAQDKDVQDTVRALTS